MIETKEERAKALDELKTLCDFFQNRVKKGPGDIAIKEFNKQTKKWVSYTYLELSQKIKLWQKAFASLALQPGERIAMLLPNGLDAVCFDQAGMANSLVPVPLHAIDTAASSAYVLQDSQASVLVTTKFSKWEAIKEAGFSLNNLKKIILTEEPEVDDSRVTSLSKWLNQAHDTMSLPSGPTEEDLACVVYTSGTTGQPKGVKLTHKNIASNVRSTLAHVKPEVGDVFLSFLPLSHMFERTAGYYLALATGSTIVFNRSLQYLAEDFKLVKPNVLISVPRIYERVYAKINGAISKKGNFARLMFDASVNTGWKEFCKLNKIQNYPESRSFLEWLAGKTLKKRISSLLKEQFGGNLRVAISGGAPLSPKVARLFCGLGLPVIQGYGMTETSPIISGNHVRDNDPSTVGRPLKDVEVRLGENDEIQVKGDLVTTGYWGRPEDTKRAFTKDGWFRTGDQGAFDGSGRLKIVGRIKEIIVTSTGEKISPVDIEAAVETLPLVNQCYAVGEGRPYIAVLLSLNKDEWRALCLKLNLSVDSPKSLDNEKARQTVLKLVREACKNFPAYAVPRNICLTLDEWTIDNGLLTPTLKLKRDPMKKKYSVVLNKMFEGFGKKSF